MLDEIAVALAVDVIDERTAHGGDVAQAARLELSDGRSVFAKTKLDAPEDFFDTEAAGLRWLGETAAVAVPKVLAVLCSPPALVLQWIEVGGSARSGDGEFGRELAALHRAGAPCFGRADRRPTGSRSLPNEPFDSWSQAYAQNRLLPLADLATRTGALADVAVADLRRIADGLDARGGPPEPPARLHGDLWAGNRMVDSQGRNWLIDPAAHGGHREFDLAMMRLFGGFATEEFAAYDEVYPLADGFQERVELHQLAPLVVHAIKFGGAYVGEAQRVIARYA